MEFVDILGDEINEHTSLYEKQPLLYSESLGKDYDSEKRSLLAIKAQDFIKLIQLSALTTISYILIILVLWIEKNFNACFLTIKPTRCTNFSNLFWK
jgi:hypothetical protein